MIETARLILRPVNDGDAPRLLEYHRANREHLRPWEPDPPADFFTESYWERFIATTLAERERGVRARFLAFAREPAPFGAGILAIANLHRIERGVSQSAILGYSASARVQGHGIAREAVAAVVRHAFDALELHRLEANYQPTNERSGKLLRALGFEIVGYARDVLFLNGAWRDHILTARLSDRVPGA